MKTEPVPFDKFAKIGIYPKDLMCMPKDLREAIMSGELSPLMRVNVPVGDNSAVSIPMKIQLAHDKEGHLQLLTYQIHRELVLSHSRCSFFAPPTLKVGTVFAF